jgi:hypothetical protein
MIRALGPVLRNQKGPALKFKRTTVLDELSKRTSTHTPGTGRNRPLSDSKPASDCLGDYSSPTAAAINSKRL